MPARLIYSPKAYVFTRNGRGDILNLTNYITAGEVRRLVNQPSSADVTLRNPKKMFTIPSSKYGPAFHPMDGITIFLERVKGYPVQVFTGYLDDTPYYQMYPGTITLQATCTLKRLLYTYWDPSLPYVNAFMAQFGWRNFQGASGLGLTNTAALVTGKGTTSLQDGSIGKLLWATLTDIADWQDTHIWIEDIPTDLASRMAKLMANLSEQTDAAENEWSRFMEQVIGSGSYGGGGGQGAPGVASGPVQGAQNIVSKVEPIANKYNVPAEMVLAVMDIETTFSNKDSPGNPHYGWFQVQTASAPYAYGPWSRHIPTQTEAHDLGLSCNAFCAAAAGWVSHDSSLRGDLQQWAMRTQGVTGQNNPLYVTGWPNALATAKSYLTQYGGAAKAVAAIGNTVADALSVLPGGSQTQTGSSSAGQGGGTQTRVADMISAASSINNANYPYVHGGGHTQIGTPSTGLPGTGYDGSTIGFDCSGAVAAVLAAAGLLTTGSSIGNNDSIVAQLKAAGMLLDGPGKGKTEVTIFNRSGDHIYMRINGKYFGTAAGGALPNTPRQGAGWISGGGPQAGFTEYHVPVKVLNETATYTGPNVGANTPGTGGASGGGILSNAKSEAFTATFDFPSIQDMEAAVILGSLKKGLMHDQQILPFIQQLCQGSLRAFQSLPNGDFFAFYPDYFGETDHHPAYWQINDIEILNGGINLNDKTLVTHQFAVGDNTFPLNDQLTNEIFSSGAISIFNAFLDPSSGGLSDVMTRAEAAVFIQRYGTRPAVANYPMIRSSLFEMYLAYQQFMLAWANQFRTPFSFTFMPELFPGGKVAFPQHGFEMYISSVTHAWDYAESGFTTDAVLAAPSVIPGSTNPDLPDDMVRALVGPVKAIQDTHPSGKPKTKSAETTAAEKQAIQTVDNAVTTAIQNIF